MLVLNTAGAAAGIAAKTLKLANFLQPIIWTKLAEKGCDIFEDDKKRNDFMDSVNKKTSSMWTFMREWYHSLTESGRERLRKEKQDKEDKIRAEQEKVQEEIEKRKAKEKAIEQELERQRLEKERQEEERKAREEQERFKREKKKRLKKKQEQVIIEGKQEVKAIKCYEQDIESDIKFVVRGLTGIVGVINAEGLRNQYNNGVDFIMSLYHTLSLSSVVLLNLYLNRVVTILRCKKKKRKEREKLTENLNNYEIKDERFLNNLSEVLKEPEYINEFTRKLKEVNLSDEEDESKLEEFEKGAHTFSEVMKKNKKERIEKKEECNVM